MIDGLELTVTAAADLSDHAHQGIAVLCNRPLRTAYVEAVATEKEYRGLGLGSAVMR